jgi:RecA/RadA recombinase
MTNLDLSRFKREIAKNTNISIGFNDPTTWVDTGNYALNYRISSDFKRGIPLGKVTIFAGQTGAGKSFIAAGNLVRRAQQMGLIVVLIDTENALDEAWLKPLGVNTEDDDLIRASAIFVDDVAFIINKFMDWYTDVYAETPREERKKVLFVIDSLSMLMTPTEAEQFQKGDMKGDMGRLPKQLKALVKSCVNKFAQHDIGLVCTNHTYASQDMFDPDDKISGGQGILFASSIVVTMQRRKLKEDEEGNKTKEVKGIRSAIKVVKSRFAKPFEEIEVKIPWTSGMDPYSGLFDMFKQSGHLQKDGNKWKYVDRQGREHKYFEKEIPNGLLDLIMQEFEDHAVAGIGLDKEAEEDDE